LIVRPQATVMELIVCSSKTQQRGILAAGAVCA
jgi:hypothetical protein